MAKNIRDVARAAGVSVTTTSYVLNNKGCISEATRQRVKEAVVATGYQRKRRMAGNLALVEKVPSFLTGCLYQATAEYGYALHAVFWDDKLDTPPEFTTRQQIAGVLVYGGLWRRSLLEQLARRYPTVLLGGTLHTERTDAVWVDNAGGIYKAVDYLATQGHRRIALLNGPGNSATSGEKQVGFEQALRHTGVGAGVIAVADNFSLAAGRAAAADLLRQEPRPTAIVAGEAVLAQAVLEVGRELGIAVPADISLIAFHDYPVLETTTPPVTAIAFPQLSMAREAVNRLNCRIANPSLPGQRVLLQPELVCRQSVSRLGASEGWVKVEAFPSQQ